jgi:hypothetical protein
MVADQANDKHVPTWTKMTITAGLNTQISPYCDKELLSQNHLSIDGGAIVAAGVGFTCKLRCDLITYISLFLLFLFFLFVFVVLQKKSEHRRRRHRQRRCRLHI